MFARLSIVKSNFTVTYYVFLRNIGLTLDFNIFIRYENFILSVTSLYCKKKGDPDFFLMLTFSLLQTIVFQFHTDSLDWRATVFKCQIFSKWFSIARRLRMHLRVHTDDNSLKCQKALIFH